MNYRTLNRIFGAVVFVVALATYLLTLQSSVPFWDCGEFSAAAMWQQVPHPPGAPLWLLAAKTFEVFLPGDPGHNFNFFAALCASFSALFVYLIGVNAIERFRPFYPDRPAMSYLPTYGSALIGALAFVWSDSNWFNSVESEVYSAATLLASMAIWMMMKWDQDAEKPGHEKWLLLIAFVMGLAIGVHLLALLAIPPLALTIYFRQSRKVTAVGLLITMIVTGGAFAVLYFGTLTWIPELLSWNGVVGAVVLLGLVGLAGWAYREKHAIVFLAAASLVLTVLGYTTYAQILVRASAHPVMNENEPDTFNELARYLGREQYGSRAAWPRRHDHIRGGIYAQNLQKYGTNLPQPVGQKPNGEIEWSNINAGEEFNYMWAYQMGHMYFRYLGWNFVGRISDVQDAGVSFTGQASSEQQMEFIRPTGKDNPFPITFFALPLILGLIGIAVHWMRDWRMALVFISAFLIWGVLMALQQNQQEPQPRERDYFYTASFMIFSIWVGFGAFGITEAFAARRRSGDDEAAVDAEPVVITPNHVVTSPYPRTMNVGVAAAILAACFIAGPFNMAYGGWTLHNRAGNWLPWDYAYNLLQSCGPNAILFTNGDNDTFPIWYLQDVAGVRRDVRVVNLELAQTPWYIWQMKHEATWDAPPVPLTFSDDQIRDDGSGRNKVTGGRGQAEVLRLPVPAAILSEATGTAATADGVMEWTYTPGGGDDLFTPKNQIVRSIVEANAAEGWKRPIYFSVTSGNEYAGLDQFLRQEGMAYHVMPVPQNGRGIDLEIMKQALLETVDGDEFHTEQHYGFKFRNLNDRSVHFYGQEDHRRPINYFYHQLYLNFAENMISHGDKATAVAALDKMIEMVPPDRFGPPVPYGQYYSFYIRIAELYRDAGAADKAKEWAQKAQDEIADVQSKRIQPVMYSVADFPSLAKARAQAIMGQYDAALTGYDEVLRQAPGDQTLIAERKGIEISKILATGDSGAAKTALMAAINEYGSPNDQRSRLLLARFPDLFVEDLRQDNTEVAPEATIGGSGTDRTR